MFLSNIMLCMYIVRCLLLELQDIVYHKTAQLEASNARIANLELKLNTKNICMQNEKRDIELVKEQFNKTIFELKKECRILKEFQCRYNENKEEEESKKKFLEELPKFSSDVAMVDSNISVSEEDTEFRISLMSEEDIEDDDSNNVHDLTPPK